MAVPSKSYQREEGRGRERRRGKEGRQREHEEVKRGAEEQRRRGGAEREGEYLLRGDVGNLRVIWDLLDVGGVLDPWEEGVEGDGGGADEGLVDDAVVEHLHFHHGTVQGIQWKFHWNFEVLKRGRKR